MVATDTRVTGDVGISVLETPFDRTCSPSMKPKSVLTFIPGLEFIPKNNRLITSYKREASLVSRPNFGTEGKPLMVFSNHFPVKIEDKSIYHYDLEIEVTRGVVCEVSGRRETGFTGKKFRKLSYKINREVIAQLVSSSSQEPGQLFFGVIPVYDGLRNLYVTHPLPNLKQDQRKSFLVTLDDGSEVFAVNIKFVGQIDLNAVNLYYRKETASIPGESLQILDIIMRNGPNNHRIPIGNSLYVNGFLSPRLNIGCGREIAFGFYQAVKGSLSGPTVVVDRSTTVFYAAGPLTTFVASLLLPHHLQGRHLDERRVLNHISLQDWDRKRIERELKSLQVQFNHLSYRRKARITGLTHQSAREVTFQVKRNGVVIANISVPEYFKQEYGLDLRYPNMPCIVTGTGQNKKYLPLEVCDLLPNQVLRRRLNNDQLGQMVRAVSAQTPSERFGVIQDSIRSICHDGQVYFKEFGVSVGVQPVVVKARVLPAPEISCQGKEAKTMNAVQGVWNFDRGQHLFSVNQHLDDEWLVISFARISEEETRSFIHALTLKAQEMGMRMLPPKKAVRAQVFKPGMIEGLIEKAMSTSEKLRIIVFLVNGEEYLYNEIKLVGDVFAGIPTQCVMERNVRRLHVSFLANLILKINTKLGGVNGIIAPTPTKPRILSKKTMIIGVDVTHPSMDKSCISSVAALVGSFDEDCSKYAASVRVQWKEKAEVIKDLDQMAIELLKQYQEKNQGCLPQHIVIYRDGVSGGQFTQVLHHELRSFKTACHSLDTGYSPSITLIVVQKRHHTRFIPTEDSPGVGKNIPPGTVIDTDCVHPTDFDFYLCSHFGVQGTSRPTHYYVLYDDNGLQADELQKLTYYLCHVYAKCNRSISIPAAVQYAHLAAYRARVHIIGYFGSESSAASNEYRAHFTEKRGEKREEQREKLVQEYNAMIRVDDRIKSTMYFC